MSSRLPSVLIDLSGTLHIEDSAIPRAIEALQKLRKAGAPIRFVTNTTKESIGALHSRLLSCGFSIERNEIFTSLLAARRLIESKGVRPLLLLEPQALEDFQGIDCSNPNVVVVGLAPSQFHFDRLNQAFRLLLGGADLIAVHKAKYYKRGDGLALGPGPFVQALEYASGKKATVVGKPSVDFFQMALSSLETEGKEIDAANSVMIGDDVSDDVIGAQLAGLKSILVRTGKHRNDDELRIPEHARNCVDSFPEAVEMILHNRLL